jgi:cytochrome c peroxidase
MWASYRDRKIVGVRRAAGGNPRGRGPTRLPRLIRRAALAAGLGFACLLVLLPQTLFGGPRHTLDAKLTSQLNAVGFNGRIQSTLVRRLGRPLNQRLANVGRLLWFDTLTGLNGDNTCGGCHSPTNGFGDTQSIAIGIENNGVVGPDRTGPRNMRRAPMVLNTAFFPRLMWNSRFEALSGNPFDNRGGFEFPPPEGLAFSNEPQLLVAQAFIPPTVRTEVAGFTFPGDVEAIRVEVMRRVIAVPGYRQLFGVLYPSVRNGGPITYDMFARAIAEFEFTLTFANAPIDRYARGQLSALTKAEKHGALIFFGKGRCSACHSVSGSSNQMFTDFKTHVIAVPQLVPELTNNTFDGAARNEDYGRSEVTGKLSDRYAFRTPSLRNVAVEASYMHDGAFTSLAAAIRFHLDVVTALRGYDPAAQGLPGDLAGPIGPTAPLLAHLDRRLQAPIVLTPTEFDDLVAFVRYGLLDPRAKPAYLRRLVPKSVPSARAVLRFEFGQAVHAH